MSTTITQTEAQQLHQRIAELEANSRKERPGCACRPIARKAYLAEGRVTLPHAGGLAMPKGYAFHGYVRTIVPETADRRVPALAAVEHVLEEAASAEYPTFVDVELVNWSEVPAEWLEQAGTEEE